ncbi:MAG: hypothetical protein M1837_004161 [Sclerophora amabilis]|nr:MAG: hypothetical protein M1837_004161 [Sclerophora amabilis]
MSDSHEAIEPARWEDLSQLEKEFDDVDSEILRQQSVLQAPLYEKRQELTSRMPDFWPMVFQQAPPEVDQFVQLSDVNVISAIKNLTVTRFETPPYSSSAEGNPRSVSIKFEFMPNEYFKDEILEKKFWFRRTRDSTATSLVSEPVKIHWKKGKDLTEGLTDAAVAAWEAERKATAAAATTTTTNGVNGHSEEKKRPPPLPEQQAVVDKMKSITEGSLSFFAWFGFRGRHTTAEESEQANRREDERREQYQKGEKLSTDVENPLDYEEVNFHDEMEVFPGGEDLAVGISDELWPNALKYYTQAYDGSGDESGFEDNASSEEISDLEKLIGDDDNGGKGSEGEADGPPKKRRRS